VPLLALARSLRERGFEIVFAVRELRGAARLIKSEGFTLLQAPVARTPLTQLKNPASYPEILLLNGFSDPEALTAATHAWRDIFRLVGPDVVVFDNSPTALLAAHGTELPRVMFGVGFSSPPRLSPMPSIRPWQQIPMQRLQTSEQRALDCANTALRAVGAKPLEALYELLQVEEDILATFPELDHYQGRTGARYWGPVFGSTEGDTPRWPEGEGKKVFVYLRPDSPAFRPLAAALKEAQTPTLWIAPGLSPKAVESLSTPAMRFTSNAVALSEAASIADAACLHSGHGTTAAMLLGGVPMLLFPEHVEQMLVARNIAALGAGAIVLPQALRTGLHTQLTHFLKDEVFLEKAKQFAEKHKGFDHERQLASVADQINRLVPDGERASFRRVK